jgi:hypothetical protein
MELNEDDGAVVRAAELERQLTQFLGCLCGRLVLGKKLPVE